MTGSEIRTASRAAQNLPPTISDPATIERIARLITTSGPVSPALLIPATTKQNARPSRPSVTEEVNGVISTAHPSA